ncbi:hypothetical protein QBC47DRAFT_378659 [Echria macrotheca]|uniref:Uncharacterized protein n=1 Tax=Echria macrotheca TaxID=438768 RepID=A0AAJ0FBC4_9PEZI|nr:hypothetical protein QBC47DRAFT_378659 [Echria macrotheca]
MAPKKRHGASSSPSPSASSSTSTSLLPKPFHAAPTSLTPFTTHLNKKHIYIAHVDPRPATFKRKIFLVPCAMNLAVALIFAWRAYTIIPYYLLLLSSTFSGIPNEYTFRAADLSYFELARLVLGRALTMMIDFVLCVFVWPWPWEFVAGAGGRGSPLGWRWIVGFRDKEIYVRRSRAWDSGIQDQLFGLGGKGAASQLEGSEFWSKVREATNPMLLQQKTGYLLMNASWDLDWDAMVLATSLVDSGKMKLDQFRDPVVLLHTEKHGWITIQSELGETAGEEERRKQVFAFRDALAQMGKEDLFFRWIEIVQFESSKAGGFGVERQHEVAVQIRELFERNGVDFDAVWNEVIANSASGKYSED